MLYFIFALVAILLFIALIKFVGGILANLFKWILLGPAYVCTKIFYSITKALHIQGFIYYLLGFCSLPSFIYLCKIHIPYSRKERYIKAKDYFKNKVDERNETIAMLVFLSLETLFFTSQMLETDAIGFIILTVLFVIVTFAYLVYKYKDWNTINKDRYAEYVEWRDWTLNPTKTITENQIEEKMISLIPSLAENDSNPLKFTCENMPYGRATAFISYFQKNLDDEEPVYFSPRMSSSTEELREYGILVTTKGIYISKYSKDIEIPLSGLSKVTKSPYANASYFFYGFSYGSLKNVELLHDDYTIKVEALINFVQDLGDIPLAMLQDNVKTDFDEALESYKDADVQNAQKKFDVSQKMGSAAKAAEMGGIDASLKQNEHIYNDEVKYNMNGERGGGYAAEYGNNAFDRFTGQKVENMAAKLDEHGRQVKSGADRKVNGTVIQSKYYKTASESIGAAFKNKEAIYLNDDGTMQQIEVPRDQYESAVKEVQKRIEKGEVPNESDPNNAKKYVRKGHFTYFQANNIALAGSVEGISVDIGQGVVCSLPGAGMTVALTFVSAIWNGLDIKKAAKTSMQAGLKVVGKSAAIYTFTMQVSRDKIIDIFGPIDYVQGKELGKKGLDEYLKSGGKLSDLIEKTDKNGVTKYFTKIEKSFSSKANPIYNIADKGASKISSSSLAKSSAGKAIGLDKIDARTVTSGTVTAIVVYGPDICKAVQGKMSGKQFIKNATVSTAAIVGGWIGSSGGFIGSMIGGYIGGQVAKKVMDSFIEDDAVEMFKIIREEFLDVVMLFSLNKTEFDKVVDATIGNPEMPKILQDMYQHGARQYARELISAEVRKVLSERKKITNAMMEEGQKLLMEESAA